MVNTSNWRSKTAFAKGSLYVLFLCCFFLTFSLEAKSHSSKKDHPKKKCNPCFSKDLVFRYFIEPMRKSPRPGKAIELTYDLRNYLNSILGCGFPSWEAVLPIHRGVLAFSMVSIDNANFEAILAEFNELGTTYGEAIIGFNDEGQIILEPILRRERFFKDPQLAAEFARFVFGCMLCTGCDPDLQNEGFNISTNAIMHMQAIEAAKP